MTYSIGFRQPNRGELARELLQRLAEDAEEVAGETAYRDPSQPATDAPGAVPAPMMDFAREALQAMLNDPHELECLLGEYLTEPKPQVWFDSQEDADLSAPAAVVLDRRSRMMYDARHIFINGESYRATGRDAQLMRRLADARRLEAAQVARLSEGATALLDTWAAAGWVRVEM